MLEQLKRDRAKIENKYHKVSEPFDPFNRMAYHGWECDPATGLDDGEMSAALGEYAAAIPDTSHAVIKAKLFAFALDHMRFAIDESDYFPCFYNWNRPLNRFTTSRWLCEVNRLPEVSRFNSVDDSRDIAIWTDFDHSVPDWHALYELGFTGISARAEAYRAKLKLPTAEETAYFDSISITYSAILRLIRRLCSYSAGLEFAKAPAIRACLDSLSRGAPRTLYERLMLIYLYFILSESVDSFQVRSLGSGFDHDIEAPYLADLASGEFSADELDGFIGYFLMQFSAIGNYWGHPLYLGGTNLDGSTRVNALSYKFLDIYDELGIYSPKVQVKYSKNTPKPFLEKICDMIRRGHSSFVFVSDDNAIKSFRNRGIPLERCYDYDVKGCYEYAVRGGEITTAAYYLNLLGSVVGALENSADTASYQDIESEYMRLLDGVIARNNARADVNESYIGYVNPSPMFSATILHSLETACDGYFNGSEYNNSEVVVSGLGSAVDSLMAIKTLVFDEKRVTLAELKRILAENWSDELLRRRALSCPHKFGRGDAESDKLAERICEHAAKIEGVLNSRGGYYTVEIHSARMFIEFGKRCPATPDGRLAGEETSKNASPTQGMDRNGVTGVIRSALSIVPWRYSSGCCVDIMLHESAVRGEDGLSAMLELLRAYDEGGGMDIQFNVCSAETLRAAQAESQKYQSLQIRVCGWNVLWNNMPKSEQDKFIERAANLV